MTGLDRLWATWRAGYVGALDDEPTPTDAEQCVLCRVVAPDSPEEAHIVHRAEHVVAVMNRFPYTNGHLMVVPTRHVDRLDQLTAAESAELWRTVEDAVSALHAAFDPGGVNVGANLGAAAGAGIPGHLHVHALPRWRGDTNFMTTIGEARILPEPLSESAARLAATWPGPEARR